MKTKVFCTMLVAFTFMSVKTNACTGDWVEVYNGGSTPHHYNCEYHWFWSSCVCGDTKTY